MKEFLELKSVGLRPFNTTCPPKVTATKDDQQTNSEDFRKSEDFRNFGTECEKVNVVKMHIEKVTNRSNVTL